MFNKPQNTKSMFLIVFSFITTFIASYLLLSLKKERFQLITYFNTDYTTYPHNDALFNFIINSKTYRKMLFLSQENQYYIEYNIKYKYILIRGLNPLEYFNKNIKLLNYEFLDFYTNNFKTIYQDCINLETNSKNLNLYLGQRYSCERQKEIFGPYKILENVVETQDSDFFKFHITRLSRVSGYSEIVKIILSINSAFFLMLFVYLSFRVFFKKI